MNCATETHFLFSIFTSVTVPFCEKNCFKRSSDTCLGMFFTNKRVLMMIVSVAFRHFSSYFTPLLHSTTPLNKHTHSCDRLLFMKMSLL